jgi:hypothetical protein
LNNYFKKIHSIIRKKAIKSKYLKQCLEQIMLANYRNNTGRYFGELEAIKRYNKVLDHYEPNINNNVNWDGFRSLISTKQGEITNCYLFDTFDIELFYKD